MQLQGQTQLAQLDQLPAALREQLRSLWIESAEEYVAMLAAVEPSVACQALGAEAAALEDSRRQACQFIAPPKASALAQARPGGALGCFIKPDLLEAFAAQGRLRPRRETLPAGFASRKLPPSVRLMDQLRPVKNQGGRGTCVAFASVALREFIEGAELDFSEQFLYWACKELDGMPGAGTFIHTAMAALNEYGVCLGTTWPYNPTQHPAAESQGPPPRAAAREARQYRMVDSRPVESSLVEHYKQVLAGSDDAPGMPVIFAVLVFRSWYMSAETHRTGKITMPLPHERPLPGGHALCVMGYVDDEDVPGGGYFIVRNSWGAEWAVDSPEAPGHALMPYAYVEQCTVEAFTGPVGGRSVSMPSSEGDLAARGFTRALNEEGRDVEGRLLRAGTRVLCHPVVPEEFMEDTPANRTKFLALDRAWTPATRRKLWFPKASGISTELKHRLANVRAAREKFVSAIDGSVVTSVGMPFPQVRTPWVYDLIPYEWEPSIKHAEPVADLRDEFVRVLKKHSGVRSDLDWPQEWTELMSELNVLRIYSVSGFLANSHVVVAFVTKFTFQREGEPQIVPLDQPLLNAIQELYRQWLAEHRLPKPEFTFFTIGTHDPVPENLEGYITGEHWLTISHLLPDGKWLTKVPPPFSYRLALRDFLDQLEPETHQQRVVRIKECVDDVLLEGLTATLERVKQETAFRRSVVRHKDEQGYRRSVVRGAFLELQKQAPDNYRVYRTKDEQLAIRRAQRGEPVVITSSSFTRKWIRRHCLRVIASVVGAGLGLLVTYYRDRLGLSGLNGLLAAVPILYAGSCIQATINRRADLEKE